MANATCTVACFQVPVRLLIVVAPQVLLEALCAQVLATVLRNAGVGERVGAGPLVGGVSGELGNRDRVEPAAGRN